MRHELKTWPVYFEPTLDGRKTFEYRLDDRGFQEGDELLLKEWDPDPQDMMKKGKYTGRELLVRVGYIYLFPIELEPPVEIIMAITKV